MFAHFPAVRDLEGLTERYPMSYYGIFLFSVRKPGFESP